MKWLGKEVDMMVLFPVLSMAGVLPATPPAVESAAVAMLVLAVLLCMAAVLVVRAAGGDAGSLRGGAPSGGGGRRMHGVSCPAEDDAIAGAPMQGYRHFLRARDGAPDLRRHTLAGREAFFAALAAAPVRSQVAIDRDAYRRNLRRRRLEPGLDARVLWLLATAKSNQAERFGVGLAEAYGRVPAEDEDPVRLHLHLQELYHTRILADVVALFDLAVHPAPPPVLTRGLISAMVLMPPQWTLPAVGFGEMVGCVLFRALRERGAALFAGEPAVADRLRLLYDEILADELSHVGFVAAQLRPTGRRLMLTLYRVFGLRLALQMPELARLFSRAELQREFASFDLDRMCAEVGAQAYSFATR
jgi:hypothetical protein